MSRIWSLSEGSNDEISGCCITIEIAVSCGVIRRAAWTSISSSCAWPAAAAIPETREHGRGGGAVMMPHGLDGAAQCASGTT